MLPMHDRRVGYLVCAQGDPQTYSLLLVDYHEMVLLYNVQSAITYTLLWEFMCNPHVLFIHPESHGCPSIGQRIGMNAHIADGDVLLRPI